MFKKYISFKVGDKVFDRKNLDKKGVVVAYIVDGKLSKDFVIVRWEDGTEEMLPPDWLYHQDELEYEKELFTKKSSIEKEEVFEPLKERPWRKLHSKDYKEELINDEDIWVDVVLKLSNQFNDEEIVDLVKNGTLVLTIDKFSDKPEELVLKLKDGRKIVFALKNPVRKHLDIDEHFKLINKMNKEVNKEEFMKEVMPGEVKIRAVLDAYEFDFGDGRPILIEKEQLHEVASEYKLPLTEILSTIKRQGYWKGKLDLFDIIEEE